MFSNQKLLQNEPIDILPGETVCDLQNYDMRYKLSSPPGGLLPKTSSQKAVREAIEVWMILDELQVQLVTGLIRPFPIEKIQV